MHRRILLLFFFFFFFAAFIPRENECDRRSVRDKRTRRVTRRPLSFREAPHLCKETRFLSRAGSGEKFASRRGINHLFSSRCSITILSRKTLSVKLWRNFGCNRSFHETSPSSFYRSIGTIRRETIATMDLLFSDSMCGSIGFVAYARAIGHV